MGLIPSVTDSHRVLVRSGQPARLSVHAVLAPRRSGLSQIGVEGSWASTRSPRGSPPEAAVPIIVARARFHGASSARALPRRSSRQAITVATPWAQSTPMGQAHEMPGLAGWGTIRVL